MKGYYVELLCCVENVYHFRYASLFALLFMHSKKWNVFLFQCLFWLKKILIRTNMHFLWLFKRAHGEWNIFHIFDSNSFSLINCISSHIIAFGTCQISISVHNTIPRFLTFFNKPTMILRNLIYWFEPIHPLSPKIDCQITVYL